MEDIIKLFNECGDCELEYKIKISYNRFVELYKKLLKDSSEKAVTTTVNFIDSYSNIKQIAFRNVDGEIRREENIYNKKKLKEILADDYKLSLSRERIENRFNKKEIRVIRIKLRSSLIIDNWSYDFTVSRQLPYKSISSVPNITNEFKKINNPDSFVNDIEYLVSDSRLEFEAEFLGSAINSLEEVQAPLNIVEINPNDIIYQNLLNKMASLIDPKKAAYYKNRLGYKHLSKQVIGLTKEFYSEFHKELLVTDKMDGERASIMVYDNKCFIFGSEIFSVENFKSKNTIIIDGEYYAKNKTFYSFEVPYFNKRLSYEDAVSNKMLKKAHDLLKNHKIKTILKNTPDNVNKLLHEIKDYDTDGLIFIHPKTGISYKWKPLNQSSIDFLIKKIPSQLIGKEPYLNKRGLHGYVLMVGISYDDFKKFNIDYMPCYNKIIPYTGKYFPIQFSPPNCPFCHIYYSKEELDGQIGEFIWSMKGKTASSSVTNIMDGEWELIRIRKDRAREASKGTYFGNNYLVAEEIWMYLSSPITEEFLLKPKLTQYFKKSDPMLLPQRNFNRFVRRYLYEFYKSDNIIDLAAGQGQGLNSISKNYKMALMVDIDNDALVELRKRLRTTKDNRHKNTKYFIQQLDLNNDFRKNIQEIKKLKFPNAKTIMCHFAIHYMLNSDTSVKNFLCLVDNLSVKGTYFIFTAYNGRKIFSLPEVWEIKEGTRTKYKIVKKYKSKRLETAGQKIDVLLPFSDGEMYEENLVNIDNITNLMRKLKFKLVENRSFSHLFDQYKAHDKNGYDELNNDDKKYLDLYSYVVYQKTK